MRILVTGCGGVVASNLMKKFDGVNNTIFGIDNFQFGNPENLHNVNYPFTLFPIDFNNCAESFLESIDVLVFCATSNIIYAQTHEIETFRNNAINTIKLFQKFKGKIIYTSTASVYNNASIIPTPETAELHTTNAYDSSKLIAELFLQERGNYTTLRLSNVYGYNQRPDGLYCGVIGRMIYKALHGQPIDVIGNGEQTRDFTFVDDVTDAILKAIELPSLNTEINIASGKETSIMQIVDAIHGVLGNKIFEINTIEKRSIDTIDRRCLSIERAELLLNWTPQINLIEGIRKTIEWQKKEYSVQEIVSGA